MNQNDDCFYSIPKEFTRFPGGRLRSHGPKSGEEFREDILLDMYKRCNKITIDLTGAVGYGSSFLDESFGELGKLYGFDEVKSKFVLIADDDPSLITIILDKIKKGSEERDK